MKEDEMFEKLGYTLNEKKPFEDWIVYGDILNSCIIFDKTFKNVICNVTITPKLVLALEEKMKQLGWFDNEYE